MLLSLFVLAALLAIGLVIGVVIVLNWDDISTGLRVSSSFRAGCRNERKGDQL